MRQVQVREPWADLATGFSDKQLVESLIARVEILESRVRVLEGAVEDLKRAQARESLAVPV